MFIIITIPSKKHPLSNHQAKGTRLGQIFSYWPRNLSLKYIETGAFDTIKQSIMLHMCRNTREIVYSRIFSARKLRKIDLLNTWNHKTRPKSRNDDVDYPNKRTVNICVCLTAKFRQTIALLFISGRKRSDVKS